MEKEELVKSLCQQIEYLKNVSAEN